MPLRYDLPLLLIFVAVDASFGGWGGVIEQADENGHRHPARFESGVWSEAERNYDACKRECKGVVHCLKKFRHYLYGIHFVLETDAKTLVAVGFEMYGAGSSFVPVCPRPEFSSSALSLYTWG
jgi:hypothetical protein